MICYFADSEKTFKASQSMFDLYKDFAFGKFSCLLMVENFTGQQEKCNIKLQGFCLSMGFDIFMNTKVI